MIDRIDIMDGVRKWRKLKDCNLFLIIPDIMPEVSPDLFYALIEGRDLKHLSNFYSGQTIRQLKSIVELYKGILEAYDIFGDAIVEDFHILYEGVSIKLNTGERISITRNGVRYY